MGVVLTHPDRLCVDPNDPVGGVRICLGGPSLSDLTRGLEALASLYANGAAQHFAPCADGLKDGVTRH